MFCLHFFLQPVLSFSSYHLAFPPSANILLSPLSQLADDELDGSDRELDVEEGGDLSELQWGDSSLPRTASRQTSGTTTLTRADRSGRDTPASVDSIPLEWDHDYDLSRGLESPGGRGPGEISRGQEEEEDEYLRTAATVLSGWSNLTDCMKRINPDLFWI